MLNNIYYVSGFAPNGSYLLAYSDRHVAQRFRYTDWYKALKAFTNADEVAYFVIAKVIPNSNTVLEEEIIYVADNK